MANQLHTIDLQQAWHRFASCVDRIIFKASEDELTDIRFGKMPVPDLPAEARKYIATRAVIETAFRTRKPIPPEVNTVFCIVHHGSFSKCLPLHKSKGPQNADLSASEGSSRSDLQATRQP